MKDNTTIYFISVPIDNTYQHQMRFANTTLQRTYFNSRIISSLTFTEMTPMRAKMANGTTASKITIGKNIDAFASCNYLMYQNSDFF